MNNPHGTCRSCAWHSVSTCVDEEGDTGYVWRCWKAAGTPETRSSRMTETPPPACQDHLEIR